MNRNSFVCEAHIEEATCFCLCQSNPVFLCPTCLPKHEGHEIFPIDQHELFQALGRDQTELKRRNVLSQGCQAFLDRVMEREAAVQTEAKTRLNTVQQNYEMWLEGNHRWFESLLTMLREEMALMLAKHKYRLTSIAQKLIDKLDSLNSEDEKRFAQIPETNALMRLNEKCQEACSRAPRMWQMEYEDEVLRAFTLQEAFPEEMFSGPDDAAALLQLNRKLEETTLQLQIQTQHCVVLEKEIETLRNLSQSPVSQLQEPVPDYSTPQSRAALAKFGPYSGQDEEHMLTKRAPVVDETGVYIGQWNTRNQRHGYGKYLWKCGDIYEGQWRNDQRAGRGRFIWVDGRVYVGNFVQGKKEGFGTKYWTDGSEYSGTWVNDKRQGIGSYKYGETSQLAGDRYIGDFLDDERNGVGAYFWADGRMSVGSYKSDKRHGKGVRVHPDGDMYFGDYAEGLKAGSGCYVWPDGDVYKGQWANGNQHGRGELTHPGKVETGVWVDDVLSKG